MDSDLSNLREQMIQIIQTDLGLKRSSFPQLSLAGDVIFAYDIEKELELQRSTMVKRVQEEKVRPYSRNCRFKYVNR
jgi:hypothetical protein